MKINCWNIDKCSVKRPPTPYEHGVLGACFAWTRSFSKCRHVKTDILFSGRNFSSAKKLITDMIMIAVDSNDNLCLQAWSIMLFMSLHITGCCD